MIIVGDTSAPEMSAEEAAILAHESEAALKEMGEAKSIFRIITLTLLQQKQKFNIILLMHQWVGGQAMNKEEQVIMGFRDLYNKMVSLNKFKMEDRLKGNKSSEVHCIEYIGKNVDSNVTKLAESFYMTRGAISKLTKKLIKRGIIESYQKPDNKKEIYFSLTSQGQVINKVHEELHKEFQERDKAVFEQVSEEQFDIMLSFVEKYSRHLDAEIKKQGVDITNRNDFEQWGCIKK